MNLTGRVVAVTGAGSGIGAALAREAAARGASAVAVIDLDEASARVVADELVATGVTAKAYQCDISDFAGLERTVAAVISELGLPGLVCANAGVGTELVPLLEETPDNMNWVLSVNVVGAWATLRTFGRAMVAASEPGWLMVTASEHSLGLPFPGNGSYTMSKHAALGMADVLRTELPDHVGISALVPGLVATGLSSSSTRRPERFGGPAAENDGARLLMTMGMGADVVARTALDGVANEQFIIATHPHARRYWEKRSADIENAFTALAATDVPEDSYDVGEIIARFS